MREKVCVALDVSTAGEAIALVNRLAGRVGMFKVGSQLFTAEGPSVIRAISNAGSRTFLDLKFHDIPNTVVGAALAAAMREVYMLTVHALGGSRMMRCAAEAMRDRSRATTKPAPLIVAITILTSMSEEDLRRDLLIDISMAEYVAHLARQAKQAGLAGVVCSPSDVINIKRECGDRFLAVVPGIRPAWATRDDQERVNTPRHAVLSGADYLVIGRPIIASASPERAVDRILEELEGL